MIKFNTLQIVVKMTDGEVIEGDKISRDEILKGLQKQFPGDTIENLEESLEEHIEITKDTLSSFDDLTYFQMKFKNQSRSINPKLIKYVDFILE